MKGEGARRDLGIVHFDPNLTRKLGSNVVGLGGLIFKVIPTLKLITS